MKKEELNKIQPLNNLVLIKIDKEFNNHIKFKESGVKLYIDPSYSKERHSTVTGEVVRLPSKLIFNDHKNINSMQWLTSIELEIGDKVWCNWTAFRKAFDGKKSLSFVCEGGLYLLINYGDVIVSKRGDDIICLNGYCLVEPILQLDLPENLRDEWLNKLLKNDSIVPSTINKPSKLYGRVFKLGKPNEEYMEDAYSDGMDEDIQEGDIILFAKAADLLLEYELHKSLLGDRAFYKIQRRLMKLVYRGEKN